MSTTYKTRPGDTFRVVSIRAYGTDAHADLIASANPGAAEPFAADVVLNTPPIQGAPKDKSTAAAFDGPEEVAVLIDGTRFRYWSAVRISRALDRPDAVQLSAPFEPDAPDFRDTFRPFSYKPLTVTVGGTPLFTGTMVGVHPAVTNTARTMEVNGYSLPGVLADCNAPANIQIEFDDMDLPRIATALCKPFGLSVQFDGPPGSAFEREAIKQNDKVADFLADLARQRNLVLSSSETGALVFQQSTATGSPVAQLTQGASPVIEVLPTFNPQSYYSHITALEDMMLGTDGSNYTVKNPHLEGVLRPMSFQAPDVEGGDIKTAALAKTGRMFGNMASFGVTVDTWRDPSGALWRPNTTLILTAPGAMVYSPFEFIVRSVSFERTATEQTAQLELVLPGSFSGEIPESMPWD